MSTCPDQALLYPRWVGLSATGHVCCCCFAVFDYLCYGTYGFAVNLTLSSPLPAANNAFLCMPGGTGVRWCEFGAWSLSCVAQACGEGLSFQDPVDLRVHLRSNSAGDAAGDPCACISPCLADKVWHELTALCAMRFRASVTALPQPHTTFLLSLGLSPSLSLRQPSWFLLNTNSSQP